MDRKGSMPAEPRPFPMRCVPFLAATILGCLAFWSQPAHAAPAQSETVGPAIAIAADLQVEGGRTRLTVTLSRPVRATTFVLERPDRAIVDLPEVSFHLPPGSNPRAVGLVSSLRYGLIAQGRSRIVVDLAGPAVPVRTEMVTNAADGVPRLVVEFAKTDRDAFRRKVASGDRDDTIQTTGSISRSPEPAMDRPVVVVDAGHGGVDPGAKAINGEVEKDIVLAFAERLRDTLLATGRYRVVMTRDRDIFVPLDERVRRARVAGADLFISIHADSISSPAISGATIYTGAERATDVESATLAERENQSDANAGVAGGEQPGGVSDILQDLMVRETRGFSHRFAGQLFGDLRSTIRFSAQPHREAGFRVLRSADVPSVLVELGYLSNTADVAHLLSEDWRRSTAAAMASAVDRFFALRLAGGATAPVSP
jgi:N-acetylmuramoyl-L-alanine amidase